MRLGRLVIPDWSKRVEEDIPEYVRRLTDSLNSAFNEIRVANNQNDAEASKRMDLWMFGG